MVGEFLICWTIRLAVVCYAARLIRDAGSPQTVSSMRAARWLWTIGCVFFLAHVAAAFHFEHQWDHAAAYSQTARRTLEMTGWNSGIGLYVNEAFLCLWLVDVILWWHSLSWPLNRPAYWTVQAIFGFLMFQATVVFGPFFWKPIAFVFIGIVIVRIRNGQPSPRRFELRMPITNDEALRQPDK